MIIQVLIEQINRFIQIGLIPSLMSKNQFTSHKNYRTMLISLKLI